MDTSSFGGCNDEGGCVWPIQECDVVDRALGFYSSVIFYSFDIMKLIKIDTLNIHGSVMLARNFCMIYNKNLKFVVLKC